VDEKASSIEEGIELAKEAIDSGKALKHLEKIIEVSQKLGK
jgi:anthranilate phosphoribosyltransferase